MSEPSRLKAITLGVFPGSIVFSAGILTGGFSGNILGSTGDQGQWEWLLPTIVGAISGGVIMMALLALSSASAKRHWLSYAGFSFATGAALLGSGVWRTPLQSFGVLD